MKAANSNTVSPTVRGNSDVAYVAPRDFWTSVAPGKALEDSEVQKKLQNNPSSIEAKKALDLANQKQAAQVATGVVTANVASQAGVAARDAVLKNNSSTKKTITFGVAAVATVVAAGIYILKRKKKH